jgi:hypothetical protein
MKRARRWSGATCGEFGDEAPFGVHFMNGEERKVVLAPPLEESPSATAEVRDGRTRVGTRILLVAPVVEGHADVEQAPRFLREKGGGSVQGMGLRSVEIRMPPSVVRTCGRTLVRRETATTPGDSVACLWWWITIGGRLDVLRSVAHRAEKVVEPGYVEDELVLRHRDAPQNRAQSSR